MGIVGRLMISLNDVTTRQERVELNRSVSVSMYRSRMIKWAPRMEDGWAVISWFGRTRIVIVKKKNR